MRPAARRTTAALAFLLAAALARPALADEYTVQTFQGGYQAPGGTAPTAIGSNQDDVTAEVSLPFAFPYFGRTYDRVSVCSNGWAALGTTTVTTSVNPALPNAGAPNAVLAPLWDDLRTGGGIVRTFTDGDAPSRVFVIDWNGVQSFDGQASGLSFQVRLHEGSGLIEMAYAPGGTWSGLSYTAGLESPDGAVAYSAFGTGNGQSGAPAADVRFVPRVVNVAGRLLRDRPVADETGLGNTTETGLPVAGATVRLVLEDDGAVAATARTAEDGSWALTGVGIDGAATLAVDALTEGDAVRVVDASGAVYVHRIASSLAADDVVGAGTATLDTAVDTVSPSFRRALNVQQAAERGRAVARAAAEWAAENVAPPAARDQIPRIDVRWVAGSAPTDGSTYTPAVGTEAARIVISDAVANPDPYDDDVVLREYAQHVLASLSVHPGPRVGAHGFTVPTEQPFAWAQGFAYWFVACVQDRSTFVDTTGPSSAVVDDLESPPEAARRDIFPAAAAASLWDLVDPANEAHDTLEGTLGPAPSTFVDVLATVDRRMDVLPSGVTALTASSFLQVWRADGDEAERVAAARAFIANHGVEDDDAEPDDVVAEARPVPGIGSTVSDRVLSPHNSDVFSFEVPEGAAQVVILAVEQSTATGFDLELLNAAGAVVLGVSNVAASDRSTLLLESPLALAPGTYHARVAWRDGDAARYALSVSAELVLDVPLPAWTVGVPFKQDFTAAGGIPPYTITTTAAVPGLTVTAAGTRLTGTPTTAGTWPVTVTATDSGSPAASVTEERELLVNPPLGVPTLLGVAAGRDVDRVIGSGGTDPVWAVLIQPSPTLRLVGGDALTLTGPTGQPDLLDSIAAATDSVGAVLDATPLQIVVTADLLASDGAAVPADALFGYHLDALQGSGVDVTLRFRGEGPTPTVTAFLDDAGASLLPDGAVTAFGRKLRIRGVVARETGRTHVVLARGGFTGTLGVGAKVRPPRRLVGEAGIFEADDVVEIPVDALAGARVRIDLRRSPSPTSLEPVVKEIEAPDGTLIPLPTERRRDGGKRSLLTLTASQDGRHLVRVTGAFGTTGPLFHTVKIRTPRTARLVLD